MPAGTQERMTSRKPSKITVRVAPADVLLRIRADDASARCQLGNKYGCEPGDDAVAMLRAAREFRVNVIGVSFHVVSIVL